MGRGEEEWPMEGAGLGKARGSGAALAREQRCRAGGAHVASRGEKRREGSGTRERKEGAGRPTGGTIPGVGPAYQ
jgi:hypothetical protein